MSGVDLNTVRELMGHKDITMTLRYSHLSPTHKQRAVDILGRTMDAFWTLSPSTKEAQNTKSLQMIDNQLVEHCGE